MLVLCYKQQCIKRYVGLDHRVGHCSVLHVTAASVHASCLRCLGAGRAAALLHALAHGTRSCLNVVSAEVVRLCTAPCL